MAGEATPASALEEAKRAARAAALGRRGEAANEILRRFGADYAGEALARNFLAAVPLVPRQPVSAFWPVRDEIDVRPLLHALHARGHVCGLPVIVKKGAPLVFRRWRPEVALVEGRWGIPVPPAEAEDVIPELVVVPLLAFDRGGNRLGYGAGFYDRTLAGLRGRIGHRLLAVGAAFAAQEVAKVPADESDERLDWVVTEKEALRIAVPG